MLTQLIFDWAQRTPDRTAMIYNGQSLSYRAFAHHIAVARGYFARRGYVGEGCAVLAIYSLLDFWVLSLALRSLGLTTVAVQSAEAVGKLGLPNLRCVITSSAEKPWDGLDDLCAGMHLPVLSVSLAGESALGFGEAGAASYPPGGHILQTSGTTGSYKLVLMSPSVDALFLRRKVEVIGMNRDTVLAAFDFGAWTAAGYRWAASPWIVGGACVIELGDKPYQALLHPGITHAVLVPSNLAAVLAAPADAFPRNDTLQLTVGGGTMTQSQVEQTRARITPHLFNWLASTEAGGITHTLLRTPEDHRWHRLIPDRVVEIVDEFDHPVPTGVVGRIRVGNAGGPDSYLHDETATRAFFKDGYFYPGDLAVIRPDGRMALQGRLTDIINVRGQKISPAPIEERLCEMFGVSGVCLFSMQGDSGEEEIHVVVESPVPLDSERLYAALRQELQEFPRARIYYIPALARNQMGKVMRQTVRAQATASQSPLAGIM
jgi:acyl-coenzyme A synthetase/AMP-(fatty) acid ligase